MMVMMLVGWFVRNEIRNLNKVGNFVWNRDDGLVNERKMLHDDESVMSVMSVMMEVMMSV